MDRRSLLASLIASQLPTGVRPRSAALRTRLILFQPGIKARTPWLVSHRKHIETLPFDELMVNIPQTFSVMSGERFEPFERWYNDWLAPLASLWQRPLENWLLAYIDRPGNLFDERAWGIAIENWRDLARGAARAGFTGIVYENEQ